MKTGITLVCLFFLLASHAQKNQHTEYKVIDTASFQNSAHHWYDIFDDGNVVNAVPNQPKYKATELTNIADNILLYQKTNGGWPKNYDMRAILTEEQKQKLLAVKNTTNTTFDNSTTHSHVACLANVYHVTKLEKYKTACLAGIDFMLASQYENGGWPQYFPLEKNYSRDVTYNDDVMTGIMIVFMDVLNGEPQYSFIDAARREKIKAAFKNGMACIMKMQLNDGGKLTAWCQQYDEVNLQPAWARAYEMPSICNNESAGVVLFLMSINKPSPEIINSIQNAVRWFEDSKIHGIRVKTIAAEPIKYKFRFSKTDRVVVNDSLAPPIWTRYYELGTRRPIFCNRDSKVVYSLAEVDRERRDGYGWYTYAPQEVLNKYPEWQQQWATGKNVLK